jgi:hypothetical protein
MIAAATLGIFAAYFGTFYVLLDITSVRPKSPMIVDPVSFTSAEAFVGFFWLVMAAAVLTPLVLSLMMPLYLEHLSQMEEVEHKRPTVEVVEVERGVAAVA